MKNQTPFAAIVFEQFHRDGWPMTVIAVRANYRLAKSGSLTLADDQQLVLSDEYAGNPLETQLFRVSDLVPFKPRTDVIVTGFTYPPDGRRSTKWQCGVQINDFCYKLHCHGLRYWMPREEGHRVTWSMSDTTPVDRIPLDYAYSCGSLVVGAALEAADNVNPRGAFLLDPQLSPAESQVTVAMLDSEEAAVADPYTAVEPQGMAPVPPFIKFRQQYAGTYDKTWLENRHPQLPTDFDYRFYQVAHPRMIYPGYLNGGETVTLAGLLPDGKAMQFSVPEIRLYAICKDDCGQNITLKFNLDGLYIDLQDTEEWCVDLTWRVWLPVLQDHSVVEICEGSECGALSSPIYTCSEDGLLRSC